jgi:alkaline phosphatase
MPYPQLRKKSRLVLSSTILSCVSFASLAGVIPDYQQKSNWYTDAQSVINNRSLISGNTATAKNVIVFIGDGMGISTLTASRIYMGQQQPNNKGGEEYQLAFEKFPNTSLIKTYNTNQQTPDSAGTMSAIMTGVKTKAGVISVSEKVLRGNCLSSLGENLITVEELAEKKGLSTGIVTTARITHATPAAVYAHTPERNWEADSNLTAEAKSNGCKDIAWQMVKQPAGDGLEVALGGGRRNFLPNTVTDPEGKKGKRKDGQDLTQAWLNDYSNSAYVYDKAGLDKIDTKNTQHLLGLFESSHMEYEADRKSDTLGEPSLAEMTSKAIEILKNNQKGFFLMVEGGRIDHAHHAGNAYRALTDTQAFNEAVATAVKNTNPDDTLIIVTADHSHVFTMAGYPKRGNPILGKVVLNDASGAPLSTPALAKDNMPYTTLGYTNGRGFATSAGGDTRYGMPIDAGRKDLTNVDTTDSGFHQEALVPLSAETHAGEDVSVHATGPGAYLFQGAMEQNVIFHVINQAASLGGTKY